MVVKRYFGLSAKNLDSTTWEDLLACCLILLDKNPGVCPVGVGEILRGIAGKVAIAATRNDVITSVRSLEVCTRHDAGVETLVHTMRLLYNEKTEAVILVDTENAFNSVNGKAFLHNIGIISPSIVTFVRNCYSKPSLLFLLEEWKYRHQKEQHNDPLAVTVYAMVIILLT